MTEQCQFLVLLEICIPAGERKENLQEESLKPCGFSLSSIGRFEKNDKTSFVSLLKIVCILNFLGDELFTREVCRGLESIISNRN